MVKFSTSPADLRAVYGRSKFSSDFSVLRMKSFRIGKNDCKFDTRSVRSCGLWWKKKMKRDAKMFNFFHRTVWNWNFDVHTVVSGLSGGRGIAYVFIVYKRKRIFSTILTITSANRLMCRVDTICEVSFVKPWRPRGIGLLLPQPPRNAPHYAKHAAENVPCGRGGLSRGGLYVWNRKRNDTACKNIWNPFWTP